MSRWSNGAWGQKFILDEDYSHPLMDLKAGDIVTDEEYQAINYTGPVRRLKASDIPDDLMMSFILKRSMTPREESAWGPDRLPRWVFGWDFKGPLWDNYPTKVIVAKINALQKRGLISACTCGCRMDIEITRKGAEYLAEMLGVDIQQIEFLGG